MNDTRDLNAKILKLHISKKYESGKNEQEVRIVSSY